MNCSSRDPICQFSAPPSRPVRPGSRCKLVSESLSVRECGHRSASATHFLLMSAQSFVTGHPLSDLTCDAAGLMQNLLRISIWLNSCCIAAPNQSQIPFVFSVPTSSLRILADVDHQIPFAIDFPVRLRYSMFGSVRMGSKSSS